VIVDVVLTVWCERVERGCTFVARAFVDDTFYSGSGANAFEAIAWCLDDLVRRRVRGEPHRMAVRGDATPGAFG
jgi:hypothetical protein